MRAVGKWALDKPPLLKHIAPFYASYVRSYDGNFKEIKERRLSGKQYQVERLSLWFTQYHTFHGQLRRLGAGVHRTKPADQGRDQSS